MSAFGLRLLSFRCDSAEKASKQKTSSNFQPSATQLAGDLSRLSHDGWFLCLEPSQFVPLWAYLGLQPGSAKLPLIKTGPPAKSATGSNVLNAIVIEVWIILSGALQPCEQQARGFFFITAFKRHLS